MQLKRTQQFLSVALWSANAHLSSDSTVLVIKNSLNMSPSHRCILQQEINTGKLERRFRGNVADSLVSIFNDYCI